MATLFHKFYNACRVQGEDEKLMQARISLCLATRIVLANLHQTAQDHRSRRACNPGVAGKRKRRTEMEDLFRDFVSRS